MKAKDDKVIQKVYDTAEELLLTQGLSGWNMSILAMACGLTKRTLYKIVPSKEELLETIILGRMVEVQNDLGKLIAQAGPFCETVHRLVDVFAGRIQVFLGPTVKSALTEYPALEERFLAQRMDLVHNIALYLEQGKSEGRVRHDVDVNLFLESLQGLVLHFTRWGAGGDEDRRMITLSIGFLLDGIFPKENRS